MINYFSGNVRIGLLFLAPLSLIVSFCLATQYYFSQSYNAFVDHGLAPAKTDLIPYLIGGMFTAAVFLLLSRMFFLSKEKTDKELKTFLFLLTPLFLIISMVVASIYYFDLSIAGNLGQHGTPTGSDLIPFILIGVSFGMASLLLGGIAKLLFPSKKKKRQSR